MQGGENPSFDPHPPSFIRGRRMPSTKRFQDNLSLFLSLFEDRERLSVKGKEEKVESPLIQ